MPEHEDDHLTPATRLLEKRREMAEVEQALAAQKEVGNYYKLEHLLTILYIIKYRPISIYIYIYIYIYILNIRIVSYQIKKFQ